tara:strand:+ start:151 stop:360 length:210 start_codon:yes stop_codon:yes gene_type:complete
MDSTYSFQQQQSMDGENTDWIDSSNHNALAYSCDCFQSPFVFLAATIVTLAMIFGLLFATVPDLFSFLF